MDYLKLVQENGFYIKDVPVNDRTEEICIAAVTDKPMAIRHIANPSEAVCKAALQKDPDVVDFIDDELVKMYGLKEYAILATSEQQKKAKLQQQAEKDAADIKYLKGGGSLENIESPSYEVCEIAVKNDGYTLKYVPEELKTAELCEIAVKEDGWALYYVPKALKTAKLCEFAVKINGLALQFVPEKFKTAELCRTAVNGCGWALEYVPENLKTAELCEFAVTKIGWALKFVPEALKTAELCEIAVKINGLVLQFVPENLRSVEMCEAAIRGDECALEFVPEHIKPLMKSDKIEKKVYK